MYSKSHTENAKKRNAVEIKADFKFPEPALSLFSREAGDGQKRPAVVEKVTCIHMFESMPHQRIAIAYVLRLADSEVLNIVNLYAVGSREITDILICNDEVT